MHKTIFISSTYEDLKSFRSAIWDLLGSYDVDVRGMEKFGARTEAPLVTCISEVEQCDIFACIIAYRIGSIDEGTGKSYTQLEYERASELKKEILVYLIDEQDAKVSYQHIDFDDKKAKLVAFKSTLKKRHTVDTFISEEDIVEKFKRRLDSVLLSKQELPISEVDEYAASKEILEKFLLLPGSYTGREIKLLVDFQGEPFPASKPICNLFNLEYGKTIGIPIKMRLPNLSNDMSNAFKHIFIDQYGTDDYFSLKTKTNIQLYGKVQFSENIINNVCANFIRKEYYEGGLALSLRSWESQKVLFGEKRIIEVEGTIILKLTRFIK